MNLIVLGVRCPTAIWPLMAVHFPRSGECLISLRG